MKVRNIVWPTDVNWDDPLWVPLPLEMVPFVMGAVERLHYRASYATDDDFDRGLQDTLKFELMEGRVQMEEYLERIATALETQATLQESLACICALSQTMNISNIVDSFNTVYIQDQIDNGRPVDIPVEFVVGEGDPPEEYEDWEEYEADTCELAQGYHLAVITAWENGVNKALGAITLTTAALDTILVATFGVGIPLVAAIDSFVAFAAYGPLQNEELMNVDTIESLKEALVCAIYNSDDAATASGLCQEAINAESGNLTLACLAWLKVMYSPMMLERVYNRTADLNFRGEVVPGYCTVCEPPGAPSWEYIWPPCENGAFLEGGGSCWNNLKCFNGLETPAKEEVTFPANTEGYEWTSVTVRVEWTSRHPSSWQVGTIRIEQWEEDEWVEKQQIGLPNNADAGNPCYKDDAFDQSAPWEPGQYRWVLAGQQGQNEWDPYPLMLSKVALELVEEPIE